jgi:hypothetical protein
MKNLILLSSVCLLILFVGASSLAQDVFVPVMPRGNPQQSCPRISVLCPSDIKVGESVVFSANVVSGNPNATPTYSWEVFGGIVIEGQGTPAIRVNKVGRQGVTATLSVGGLDSACAKTASCSILPGTPAAPAVLIDRYYPKSTVSPARKKLRARRSVYRRH